MANKMNFPVVLQLIADGFVKGLAAIKRQVAGFSKFMVGAFALGGITQFGRKMIDVSSEFEDAMARVQAVSNATAEGFKMMETEARHLGATTKYTATEAANALENLTRNGLTAAQATQALRGTLQLAQANAIGLAEAANIVTNTMNMFGLKTKDVSTINDVLSRTASTTATNITLLYEALVNAAPTAHNLDISLEEVSATLGAMAQRGVKGAEAGTQLRMALTKMVDPKIVKKLHAAGVEIDENVIRNKEWIEVLRRLKDANLDMSQLVEIFSQRGAHGIVQLIGSYNDLKKVMWELEDAQGTTQRMFLQGLGSTKGALLMLKSAYQEFLITVGNQTRGVFNGAVKILTTFVRSLDSLGEAFLKISGLILPLFTKKIIATFNVVSAKIKKAAADATLFKVAVGDWIGVLITAVSWIAILGGTLKNSVNKELKNLQTGIDNANIATKQMETQMDDLIKELGTEYNEKTLNGVISKACRLFPDFKDAIMQAGIEAGKTKGYDDLKLVLEDIVKLQTKMIANTANQQAYEGYMKTGGEAMRRASKRDKKAMGIQGIQEAMERAGYSKESQENVYSVMLDMRVSGRSDQQIKEWLASLVGNLDKGFERFNHAMDRQLVEIVGKARDASKLMRENEAEIDRINENGKYTGGTTNNNNNNGGDSGGSGGSGGSGKTPEQQARERFAKAIDDYAEDVFRAQKRNESGITTKEEYDKELLRAEESLIDAYLSAAYTLKDESILERKQYKDTVKSYNERNQALKDAANSLKEDKKDTSNDERIVKQIQDIMREAEAGPKYNKKNKNPWDAFSTDPKEYRDEQIALQALEDEMNRLQRLYDNASEKMEELGDSGVEGADEARAAYNKLGNDLSGMIEKVAEKREELGKKFAADDMKELKYKNVEGYYNAIKTTTQAVNTLADTLQNLADADWGDMNLVEKFQAVTSAIFSVTDAIKSVYDSFKSLNEIIGQLSEAKRTFEMVSKATSESNAAGATTEAAANLLAAKSEEVKGAAAEQAAKKTAESAMVSVAANTAEAGAGAAASQASIPYVGPILAAAAAAGIIAMLAATLPKFAKGGIVQGTSKYGDRLLARVNAGEAILNQQQQKRFMDIANGKIGGLGGQQVQFYISGKDLRGVLRNVDSANSRIAGSKGL